MGGSKMVRDVKTGVAGGEKDFWSRPPGGTSAAQHPGFPRLKVGIHFPCAVALSLRWFVAAATGS